MSRNKGPWTELENDLLKAMALKGASIVRAAAAFKRTTKSVRIQARKLGTPFPSARLARLKWANTPSNEWRRS
jgi:hypothetical protein